MKQKLAAITEFIRAIQDDPDSSRQLQYILKQSDFHRKSLLNSMIAQMRFQNEDKGAIEALSALRDDFLAQEALKLLK